MIKHYNNILTEKEILTYVNLVKQQYYENKFKYHEDTKSVEFSFSSEIYMYESCVERLDKIIKADFGSNYTYSHCFPRVYLNGSVLLPHTDRDGLDITLSVNLFNDTEQEWPLHVSNIHLNHEELGEIFDTLSTEQEILPSFFEQQTSFEELYNKALKEDKGILERLNSHKIYSSPVCTSHGSGAAFNTAGRIHWRYPLKCAEDKKYIQIFYHWKKDEFVSN